MDGVGELLAAAGAECVVKLKHVWKQQRLKLVDTKSKFRENSMRRETEGVKEISAPGDVKRPSSA